ncbi:hypothetical protein ABT367_14095, partial [Streptomyces mesophilus]
GRLVLAGVGWVCRLMLRACRGHAAEMERGVAAAAADRAQTVDYGLRIVAQEQVGLAYAGWDRLLTKVALPAWRMGRWPSRLDAGVVAALTELSRRDRLAEGFASRLGERPACDLLEEPGAVDEAASLLAARLFHGEQGAGWAPVDWQEYPEEVVDRKWRMDAARLHRALDSLGVGRATAPDMDPQAPTLARVMEHLASETCEPGAGEGESGAEAVPTGSVASDTEVPSAAPAGSGTEAVPTGPAAGSELTPETGQVDPGLSHLDPATPDLTHNEALDADHNEALDADHNEALDADHNEALDADHNEALDADHNEAPDADHDPTEPSALAPQGEQLAAVLTVELAREESTAPSAPPQPAVTDDASWDDALLPLFPMQPPRSGRELLADHVTAMVCCAAVDTAGAAPGLDWLDGPTLLVDGVRAADLSPRVLSLVEDGDPEPLRGWLAGLGVRPEKPVRLV